jgi:hypothetical protein
MEAAGTSETSVYFYQTTRRNIPEDTHLHINHIIWLLFKLPPEWDYIKCLESIFECQEIFTWPSVLSYTLQYRKVISVGKQFSFYKQGNPCVVLSRPLSRGPELQTLVQLSTTIQHQWISHLQHLRTDLNCTDKCLGRPVNNDKKAYRENEGKPPRIPDHVTGLNWAVSFRNQWFYLGERNPVLMRHTRLSWMCWWRKEFCSYHKSLFNSLQSLRQSRYYSAFYGIRRSIVVFYTACRWVLSWVTDIDIYVNVSWAT